MTKYLIISLLFTCIASAQGPHPKKVIPSKDQLDDSDKQLLKRDVCRKPIEALETKYDQLKTKELEEMKKDCQY